MKKNKTRGRKTARVLAGALTLTVITAFGACSMAETDGGGLSAAEEEFVQEQVSASMSSDDGGTAYAAETLSDPEFYQDLDAESGTTNPATGYRSVAWTLELPYSIAGGEATVSYRLYDGNGDIQTAFSAATRSADVILEYGREIDAVRFTAGETSRMEVSVTGLNTATVTVSGSCSYEREVDGSADSLRGFHAYLESSGTLNALTLVYRDGSWSIGGGSAAISVTGSVNDCAYSRAGEWTFGEGGTATLTLGGVIITVNVATGEMEA